MRGGRLEDAQRKDRKEGFGSDVHELAGSTDGYSRFIGFSAVRDEAKQRKGPQSRLASECGQEMNLPVTKF